MKLALRRGELLSTAEPTFANFYVKRDYPLKMIKYLTTSDENK